MNQPATNGSPTVRRRPVLATAVGLSLVASLAAASAGRADDSAVEPAAGVAGDGVPAVSPTPRNLTRTGSDVVVPGTVRLVADDLASESTKQLVRGLFTRAGATVVTGDADLTVHVGSVQTPAIAAALDGVAPDSLPSEGYVLDVAADRVVLAAGDADGLYYAAQTLRQLVAGAPGAARLAGVRVIDSPAMPLRGSIEGFYGSPWTHAERLDQLAFYGEVKMNTYIYAPKDDPYHRDRWREPYPPAELARIKELVAQAAAHHVDFTFAVSPGTSVCYSRDTVTVGDVKVVTSDIETLIAKLEAMYAIGVRSFSIPLDDISTSRWSCAEDYVQYGLPNNGTAARAHIDLLEGVLEGFIKKHPDVAPLQTVPTDYAGLAESAYTRTWRDQLDPAIVVMWTGVDVVPKQVTNDEAQRASARYGRKVFLWDNTPVNDFDETRGRLLLAPYDKRQSGLSSHLTGIVSNPMNQAAASKVALHTIADFTWNDAAYDRDRAWAAAARYLASGDAATTSALLTFFDLNHLAPLFGTGAWQPQAPGLAATAKRFKDLVAAGETAEAQTLVSDTAAGIAAAPPAIRRGVTDALFLSDAKAWLDACELWGAAAVAYADALAAARAGDRAVADAKVAEGKALVAQAREVRAPAGENRWSDTRVRLGDPVLDGLFSDIEAFVAR